MPEIIERTAKLFEAGSYPDKNIEITTDALDTLAQSFTSIPVKVEHADTPFDGALGNCTKVWRDGNDLKGIIGFSPEAWQLIDKAGAKKLSIGVKRDLSALTEVSLVKNPRVQGAAVFNDHIELSGKMVENITFASWQGLSADDIEDQIKSLCKPAGDGWCYVEELGQDYAVVETTGLVKPETYTKYQYSIVDKKVVLETGETVEKQTKWIPVANMSADPINGKSNDLNGEPTGGVNMPEIKNGAIPAEGTANFTDEQKAFISQQLKEFSDAAEAKFTGEIARLTAENKALADANKAKDVQFKLDEFKRVGKLVPACEDIARAILMSGSQEVVFNEQTTDVAALFSKFIDTLPEIVKFGEQGINGEPAVNMSAEEATFYEKITGKKPGQEAK